MCGQRERERGSGVLEVMAVLAKLKENEDETGRGLILWQRSRTVLSLVSG